MRIEGTEEKAYLEYLVRDHEIKRYNLKQQLLIDIKARFNEKYGVGTVTLKISEQYQNMANSIDKNSDIIQNVIAATSENGLKTIIRPLRGSSTGAKFSAMGIVCPNLGVGGFAYHGPYEHITKEDMERVVDIITSLIRIFTETRDDFR
ncbi:Peptidase T [bioreactor metagenome]|uniref:Peptidase T n=1 Tax=bioreactor metagenome TaxID=1076179 RepID=A0A645IJ57_9ZZZZ